MDQGSKSWSFQRLDLEAIQFVPLVRGHWVLALRGAVSLADPFEGDEIPWFMLPTLGGSRTLRAYPTGRFRDRRTVLAAAEWRTFLNRALDLAFFYEAGAVAPRWDDLRSSDLAPSVRGWSSYPRAFVHGDTHGAGSRPRGLARPLLVRAVLLTRRTEQRMNHREVSKTLGSLGSLRSNHPSARPRARLARVLRRSSGGVRTSRTVPGR